MKKIIILLGLLCLTGCSKEKSLSCNLEKDASGNKVVQNIIASFKNDKVLKIDMKNETFLKEEYVDYIEVFTNNIDTQFDKFKNKKGITTNLSQTNNSIIFTININPLEMDEEAKQALGIDISGSYSKTKKEFENEGYSCK